MRRIASIALLALLPGATIMDASAKTRVGSAPLSTPASVQKIAVHLNTIGFANVSNREIVKATTNDLSDESNRLNGEPEHLRITFGNDKFTGLDSTIRQLIVYPVRQYSGLFKSERKTEFDKMISDLKKVIAARSCKGVEEVPVLPPTDCAMMFQNQIRYLNFKHGSGVAFLSRYGNGSPDAPIKTEDLFYTFQGLTNDGKYYLSFFSPILVKNLPWDGIKGTKYLAKLPPAKFKPDLDTIDRMLQSISLEPGS